MRGSALLIIPGFVFGAGLAFSGMTNPAKVVGFLDLAGGEWDPSLALVMVGAIGVTALGNLLVHRRNKPVYGNAFGGNRGDELTGRLFAGSATFGIAWGLSGFCPGPALANLSRLVPEVLVFVAMMAAGMILAQRILGADL